MATDVILPALGMSQDTGKIVQWLKAEGEQVVKGEPLAEIETDKATVEIDAPTDGVLAQISAVAGDDVPVGRAIACILSTEEAHAQNGESAATFTPRLVMASPKARRLAAEEGRDLAAIKGSGPEGAILAADVLAATAQPAQPIQSPGATAAHTPSVEAGVATANEDAALSTTWRIMAERTTQSWTSAPHFYLVREVNASRLINWREQVSKQAGAKVTYTDLLVKIVAAALRLHPRLNALWSADKIVLQPEIHLGLAVASEDGLVVPVIHKADTLSIAGIAQRRAELATKAQAGKLRPEDISGGTFTISNLGMYNIDAFNAIINQPQVAILAVGRISERVMPVNGHPTVQPMMVLTLSCDHRAVDGARGARFLDSIATLTEEPLGLLT
jgi:pyruvate dehydrogenase E2 component (dihydrolipoamide acetyltransferase)